MSKPYGLKNQNFFYNTAVELLTSMDPYKLINQLQLIEKKLKKNKIIINGPRSIDLDIIFFNKLIIKNNLITIPHPRAHLRNFVLLPLFEISKNWVHPKFKQKITYLLSKTNIKSLSTIKLI